MRDSMWFFMIAEIALIPRIPESYAISMGIGWFMWAMVLMVREVRAQK